MIRRFKIFISVSLRYFKAKCERIRINVQDPKDRIVVKEGDKKNISVIKNIFSKREVKRCKSDVDINQDSWGIVG